MRAGAVLPPLALRRADIDAGSPLPGSSAEAVHWLQNGQWQSRVLTQNAYTYDNAGLRLTNQLSDQNGPVRTEAYGYDELNRLTGVNYGDGEVQSYTFDPMGNRLTKVVNGTSEGYSYNNANMLLTRGASNYTNDANGNTLTGGGRTNVWDSQDRLRQCTLNSTTSAFTYGADGLRRRSVVGTNTTDYVLDSSMMVRERLNGTTSATYLIGPRGPEYRRDDVAGTVRWYVYDGLGSVLGEVAPDGTLTRSQSFDVYGGVRTSSGTATSKHKFVGYLGHPSDDAAGLTYMRARWMDPATGRFVGEDPAGDGPNRFVYAGSNPVCAVDPDDGRRRWTLAAQDWYMAGIIFCSFAVCATMMERWAANPKTAKIATEIGVALAGVGAFCFAAASDGMFTSNETIACAAILAAEGLLVACVNILSILKGRATLPSALVAVGLAFTYAIEIVGVLIANDAEIERMP